MNYQKETHKTHPCSKIRDSLKIALLLIVLFCSNMLYASPDRIPQESPEWFETLSFFIGCLIAIPFCCIFIYGWLKDFVQGKGIKQDGIGCLALFGVMILLAKILNIAIRCS